MKTIRIGHSGDWHLDQNTALNVWPAMKQLVTDVENMALTGNGLDLFILLGDLFVKRDHIHPVSLQHMKHCVQQIARHCPVLVIPGNHDAANSYDGVDSCVAALTELATKHPVMVRPIPQVLDLSRFNIPVQVACLPTPNKYHYWSATQGEAPDVEAISEQLQKVCHSMAAQMRSDVVRVMAYHGTVLGGLTDSEQVMTTGQDIALQRGGWEDSFDALMACHLHKPQEVGRWVYSGSIAPLTFAQTYMRPRWLVWTFDAENAMAPGLESMPLLVAHPLIQIDVQPLDSDPNPMKEFALQHNRIGVERDLPGMWWEGARVKVKAKFKEHFRDTWDEGVIRDSLGGAEQITFTTEVLRTNIRINPKSQHIDDLMADYIGLNDDLRDMADPLMALTVEMEEQITPAQRAEAMPKDFRLLTVSMTNYKNFAKAQIDFTALDRLTCVTGLNAAGKSNAAEAAAFALFKYLRGSSNIADVIRNGTDRCNVVVELESGQDVFRVTRTVKKPGKTASADVLLEKYNGDFPFTQNGHTPTATDPVLQWVPVNAADSGATQDLIDGLVGSQADYMASHYCTQFNVDWILSLKPAPLKDLIQDSLPLKLYAHRKELARQYQMNLQNAISEHSAKINQLQLLVDGKAGHKEAYGQAILERTRAEQRAEEIRARIESHKQAVKDSMNRLGDLNTQAAKLGTVADRSYGLQLKMNTLDVDLKSLQDVLDKRKELENADRNVKVWRGELAEQDRRLAEWQKLDAEHSALAAELRKIVQGHTFTEKEKEAAVKRAKKAAGLLADVPCQNLGDDTVNWPAPRDYEGTGDVADNCASCQFLVDASKAAKDLPDMVRDLGEWKDLRARMGINESARMGAIKTEQGLLDMDSALRDLLQQQLKDAPALEASMNRLAAAEGAHKAKSEERARADEELATLAYDADAHGKVQADVAAAEVDLFAKEGDLAVGEEARDAQFLTNQKLAQQIGMLKEKLDAAEKAEQQVTSLESFRDADTAQLAVVAAYRRAVDRDGIPFLILERAIPQLAEYTNTFLGDTDLRVQINSGMSSTAREELRVTFQDGEGQHGLSEASGFQRMALGACVHAGRILVQADATGVSASHLFLDEGFGAYDQENIQHGIRMVQKFAEHFQQVIFITHIDAMKQAAGTLLAVTSDGAGSAVEVVAQ